MVVFGPCDPCTFPLHSEDNSISILDDTILEEIQVFQVAILPPNSVGVSGPPNVPVDILDEGKFPLNVFFHKTV